MFDFAKRDLVLWLAALVMATALMALTANFAFDRLAAYAEELSEPLPFDRVPATAVPANRNDGLSASPQAEAVILHRASSRPERP